MKFPDGTDVAQRIEILAPQIQRLGLEYDTVSDRYTTFIETEVLPRISRDYNITFTKDPEGRATMGGS